MFTVINRFLHFTKRFLTLSSSLLLATLLVIILAIPLFPLSYHRILFSIFYTVIFVLSALSVQYAQKRIVYFSLVVITVEWVAVILNMPLLFKISLPINFLFFLMIVGILIVQIAKAKNVTTLVLLESISCYLLIGISFSLVIGLIEAINPNSFNFQKFDSITNLNTGYNIDYMYFAFINLTTTGFGDFLPLTPAAKSLSVLISITGQLYTAIIIAILVGKYLTKSSEKNPAEL